MQAQALNGKSNAVRDLKKRGQSVASVVEAYAQAQADVDKLPELSKHFYSDQDLFRLEVKLSLASQANFAAWLGMFSRSLRSTLLFRLFICGHVWIPM